MSVSFSFCFLILASFRLTSSEIVDTDGDALDVLEGSAVTEVIGSGVVDEFMIKASGDGSVDGNETSFFYGDIPGLSAEQLTLHSVISGQKSKEAKHPCFPHPCDENDLCRVLDMTRQIHGCFPADGSCGPGVCLNGGFCIPTGLSYRCECFGNFIGTHCEKAKSAPPTPGPTGPCSPSPCQGDCTCQDSCKREHGYYCHSPSGRFIGKNCTIEIPSVRCGQNSVELEVSSNLLKEYDNGLKNSFFIVATEGTVNAITPRNDECLAKEQGDVYVAKIVFPSPRCGVKITKSGGEEIVIGEIWMDRTTHRSFDVALPVARFECKFIREYDVSTSLSPIIELPALVKQHGWFEVGISLCKMQACTDECPENFAVTEGATYTVGEMIHVTTKVVTDGNGLPMGMNLATREVFLSCDPDEPNSTDEKLVIVENWCNFDAGLHVTRGMSDEIRSCVSFQLPRSQCSQVFIFAKVKLCMDTEYCPESPARTCSDGGRKRRSIIGHDEGVAMIGPITIVDTRATGRIAVLLPENTKMENETKLEDVVAESGSDYGEMIALMFLYSVVLVGIFCFACAVFCVWKRSNGHRDKFLAFH